MEFVGKAQQTDQKKTNGSLKNTYFCEYSLCSFALMVLKIQKKKMFTLSLHTKYFKKNII